MNHETARSVCEVCLLSCANRIRRRIRERILNGEKEESMKEEEESNRKYSKRLELTL